ncbi:EscU/YscU/HrcU family type III secretion system export apparatus switch protein [Exilibacterium tricleocarpae]|uniref:EscU/YscU/HrcU family type III secretion system export apparatus switch protein n=1 Tax=Exilibacterium tricleocarpae TaxID=2591008 RepID=A0A545U3Q8_9GAMM|nr:type III secretion system export apparatus subunit SctU [Exilibacterium tricleocarpae]TQV84086.1 EscU/YscU/HrcU family type III secretion system export apparatus switch protein [Exilibacterium tricleocarpae]
MSEKTEEPTEKKIKDSRDKGQVGLSQDITKLITAIVVFGMLFAMGEVLMAKGKEAILFAILRSNGSFTQAAGEVVGKLAVDTIAVVLIIVAIAFFLKIIGTWIQTGPIFSPKALKIDFAKLNPVATLKNMFSMRKLYELLNNVVKTAVITVVFYMLIKKYVPTLFLLPTGDLEMFWRASSVLYSRVVVVALAILLILSVFDFAMQKYFHKKQLKMSIDEVKREHKDSEGDPHVKGQRDAVRQEILESEPKNIDKLVEKADAVVVNPTHFAVALYYRENETPLPTILCKGKDEEAFDIISFAKKYDKPIIRYVWLARTLYAHQGTYIPRPTMPGVVAIYKAIRPLMEGTDSEDEDDESILIDEEQVKEKERQEAEKEKQKQIIRNNEKEQLLKLREKLLDVNPSSDKKEIK